MASHDIIVVGASAGGVETLPQLLSGLPSNFPGSVFIVLHLSPTSESHLPQILARATSLRVSPAKDHEKIRAGHIYVASPDRHLWLEKSRVRVTLGPRINRHRPAVDPLFETAAHNYGPRTVGVVLTGALDDGTVGLEAIKKCGGTAVVQDPHEALMPDMPQNALRHVSVDHCLTVAKISKLLLRLVQKKVKDESFVCPEELKFKVDDPPMNAREMTKKFGTASTFVCPECGGPLWQIQSGRTKTFKCLVGHGFSPYSLLAEEAESVERALWVAVKTLEERATLLRNLAEGQKANGSSRLFAARASEAEKQAKVITNLLLKMRPSRENI